MRVVMAGMNSNTKQDSSNLNIASNLTSSNGPIDGVAAGGSASGPGAPPALGAQSSESTTGGSTTGGNNNISRNMEYLKNLADAMSGQDVTNKANASSAGGMGGNDFNNGNGNNFQGPSSNNNNVASGHGNNDTFASNNNNNGNNHHIDQFHNNMPNNNNNAYGSDNENSIYNATRRISKDSLVSRDSLSDMLSADQVASNNLAMMNMLVNQQSQMGGGGGGGANNQATNMSNFSGPFNNGNQGQHQALNQSMSQLMMNGTMNGMNQMNNMSSMMNNAMGGNVWNNANVANNNNTTNVGGMTNNNDPLRGAYGTMNANNVIPNANNATAQPLLIPPKKTKNKHKQTFAQKLMHILSMKECQSAMRWMPNGCAFCIVDSKELVEKVLPRYFKEAKYTSFTRKLNRWGFKHFTLPTSEPSSEKEMSIYTHEKFLRDNAQLCQLMDGGHRRRNSSQDDLGGGGDSLNSSMTLGASNQGSLGAESGMAQLQQHNMMMQQMQQLQQQNMMMQQMQQHAMAQNQMSNHNQGGGNGGGQDQFDMSSALNTMAGGNNFNNTNSNVLMGNNQEMNNGMGPGNAAMGMRRTSLGFMPYLPTSNRRDSGFSVGGLSTISNDIGSSFNGGAGTGAVTHNMGGLAGANSAQSLEKFRKMSPVPVMGGGDAGPIAMNNATFDNYNNKASNNNSQGVGNGGNNGIGDQGVSQEDLNHSHAKLAVLEDMIAKERRKQSLLSGLDSDPVNKMHEL